MSEAKSRKRPEDSEKEVLVSILNIG
ncbi:MAG: hypothetical protein FD151_2096, partial [bacterium]